MPTLEDWTLWLHVAAGTVALLAGVVALVTTKGGRRHRRAGRLFVGSMAGVVATTFGLLALDPQPFRVVLGLVAVFSGYFAFSGYRVLSRKRPADAPHVVDWTAAAVVIVACLALWAWGLAWLADGRSFGLVMLVFGGIGLTVGGVDVRLFRVGTGSEWPVHHLQRMLAAFIATVSAVSAVNLTPTIGIAAWLWPTLVGVPLVAYWSNEYGTA